MKPAGGIGTGEASLPHFLIGEAQTADGALYVLWTQGLTGVWILPWGSRERRDMQALGRSLAEIGSRWTDPREGAAVIVAGARRHAAGRRLALVTLSEAERERIARTISRDGGDPPSIGARAQPILDGEVLAFIGEHLARAR